jgi:hypothetical protein
MHARATRRNIPEDDILPSYRRENLKPYIALTGWALWRRRNVSPVRYELDFYIPEDEIFHGHSPKNLKSYVLVTPAIQLVTLPTDLSQFPSLALQLLVHSSFVVFTYCAGHN